MLGRLCRDHIGRMAASIFTTTAEHSQQAAVPRRNWAWENWLGQVLYPQDGRVFFINLVVPLCIARGVDVYVNLSFCHENAPTARRIWNLMFVEVTWGEVK